MTKYMNTIVSKLKGVIAPLDLAWETPFTDYFMKIGESI